MQETFARTAGEKGLFRARLWYWGQCFDAVIKNTTFDAVWSLSMIKNYLKITLRNIRKHKGYSLINISGLVLGLASFILVSLYVQYEFSYDKYHERFDRIYRVINYQPEKNYMNSDYFAWTQGPLAPALMEDYPEVESAVRVNNFNNILIGHAEDTFLIDEIYFTDPEIFDIFSLDFLLGDPATALDNPDSIVLSSTLARKIFGSRNPMGEILTYGSTRNLAVTGIMKDMPSNSHFRMECIVPFSVYLELREMNAENWTPGWYCYTYCLLEEGASPGVLEDKLTALSAEVFKINKIESRLVLQPIGEIHLHSDINGEISANGSFKYVILFSSIAFLILIIACMNYMNLGTARSAQRGREVGMRKVVGAKKNQLVKQFLGESMVLTLISFILSLAVVAVVLPAFNAFFERAITFDLLDGLKFSWILAALILFTGIVSGGYPAFLISSFNPINAIRGNLSPGHRGTALRSILVVFQFSISIALIISTLVVKSQLSFIQETDVGYSRDRIVVLRLKDRQLWRNKEAVKQELLKNPQITAVSGSNYLPNHITSFNRFPRPDGSEESLLTIYTAYVDYDFLDLFNIELDQGRNFSRDYSTDIRGAVLLNQAAFRALGWERLGGQRLRHRGTTNPEIIGIMKDFNFQSLHNEISPLCLYLDPGVPYILSVKIRGNRIPETLKYIQTSLEAVSDDYPFEYQFFDDAFNGLYRTEQKLGNLFVVCAGLAVFLACLGLLGLVAFTAEQRTKEIGIRKVMGASVSSIIGLLSRQFLRWVLLANILSWPVAYYVMYNWLENFAYRVNMGIVVFVFSSLITLLIAFLTLSIQSIKAATADPVDSLRYE